MTEKPTKGKRPAPSNDAAVREAAAKKNDAIAAAVKEMNTLDQSGLLSQALLREYMHRKGYKKTLAVFDSESPRTDTTISSRQLMGSLMELQTIQDRNQQREGQPLGTIMEILCSYRLRKRGIVASKRGEDSKGETAYDSSDEESLIRKEVVERREKLEATKEDIARVLEERATKSPAVKKKKKVKEEPSDPASQATTSSAKKAKKAKKSKVGVDVEAESEDIFFVPATTTKKEPRRSAASYNRSANDILKSAMDTLSTLPVSSSARSGISYTRGWTPGSAPSENGDGAPQIGLSQSQSPDRGGGSISDDMGPHSFLAGDGFNLSFNQQHRPSLDRPALTISPTSTPTHAANDDFKVSPRTSRSNSLVPHSSPVSATRPVGNPGGASPSSTVSAAHLLGHQSAFSPSRAHVVTNKPQRQGMSFADAMAQAGDGKDTSTSTTPSGVSPSNSFTNGQSASRNRKRVTIFADEGQ